MTRHFRLHQPARAARRLTLVPRHPANRAHGDLPPFAMPPLDAVRARRRSFGWIVFSIISTSTAAIILLGALRMAFAGTPGWADADPKVAEWFAGLMQPDHPAIPCCGQGDAYWADEVANGPNGELIAVITDERPDEPLGREHVPLGTRYVVPPFKIKWDRGNPTGHIVIFLGYAPITADRQVICYVQNGGV
jgi:hypothetical protein